MLRNIFAKTLRDRRRSMIWWIAGSFGYLVAITATYTFFVQQQSAYESLLADYPDALLAMFGVESGAALFSPDGYLTSQAFGWLVPLLTLALGIGVGAAAVAGEEEAGTMDLLLALPVTRTSVILQKLGAMFVLVFLLGVRRVRRDGGGGSCDRYGYLHGEPGRRLVQRSLAWDGVRHARPSRRRRHRKARPQPGVWLPGWHWWPS